MRHKYTLWLLPFLLLLWRATDASAAPPQWSERTVRVTEERGALRLSIELPDLIDEPLRKRLDSGLALTLVTRAYLFKEGSSRAESLSVRTLRAAYDLWDESYLIEQVDEKHQEFREKRRNEALHRLSQLDRLFVADTSKLQSGARCRVSVIVEVNPVSPQLLQQVRRWLSRPRDDTPRGEGESYFGSFVSLFVNTKVGDAERTLRFHTQTFLCGAAK